MINFVTEPVKERWILRRLCEGWAKHIPNATITEKEPLSVPVNVFVNYRLYQPGDYKSICFFTHREDEEFDEVAKECDWCLSMSYEWLDKLPKGKSSYVQIGLDDSYYKKDLKIGVIGRQYSNGRKRFDMVNAIADIPGVNIYFTEGKIPDEAMPDFYDEMDVILVTSSLEAGPMCIKEATARRKPILTTAVGWAFEYPCMIYDSPEHLRLLVTKYMETPSDWEKGANQIISIANRLTA